ncbi:MFS transporter [Sulfolobus acidocaldarius]|uniref:Transporter n=4 Tax=Sulfolobus acidocaldarius TaxID=2285 RepID=Q4J7I0_SULAC|nr:MFS transporter [Sulfolobus acidocaldarius]AAY81251.1 transporter [Sulfolobus acidocaldarius DSM 639]AGE71882.1 transporter [Sulfolobus acidocaldarius N8]AGE74155.1 transporter [Sulfolobus acidocaldarius Ron12/I]ALU29943.1 MFS transporter [Sulfolobus acidocaldarius]ALU32686.1 MFS transporter [Sulfolobus acidocaldarius]
MSWEPSEEWNRALKMAFVSFSAGMFLESFIFGLESIATNWYTVPKILESLLLAWAPLWLIIGIAFAGPIADRIGRKTTLWITLAIYVIGGIGLIFSFNYVLVLIFTAIMLFSAGGEMNTIMAATHEIMPQRNRGRIMFLEINFINLGGAVLGGLGLLTQFSSIFFQRLVLGAVIMVAAVVLFITRLELPESVRWLSAKRKMTNGGSVVKQGLDKDTAFKLFVTTAIAFANSAGFGLITYVLGPYFFSNLTGTIIFVADITEFIVGLVVSFLADSLSRRGLLLWSNLGIVVFTFLTYYLIPAWKSDLVIFWALLVAINAFTAVQYLTEDTFKAELWSTIRRGTYTAIARVVSIGLYIPTIFLTLSFSLSQYVLFNLGIWSIGLFASVLWYIFGFETSKGTSIDDIEKKKVFED